MDKEDIKLDDWHRLLIGDNPWGFAIEVFLRTLVIYVCLMVVMRLLGKRMNAQLTITDLAVMLTLGAIASVPMQAFDRGVLPGIILLITILLLHQGQTLLTYKSRKVEEVIQGEASLLIKEGVIVPDSLQSMRISKDQIFSILRAKGVRHLGQVKRLYSEADGHFSLYKLAEEKPGLSVYPKTDNALPPGTKEDESKQACGYCGLTMEVSQNATATCSNCGNQEWTAPIR